VVNRCESEPLGPRFDRAANLRRGDAGVKVSAYAARQGVPVLGRFPAAREGGSRVANGDQQVRELSEALWVDVHDLT